ncbi:S8 family serine peptidase [Winogradskyella thalassocola]|uniref:Por secretion system C-terminal sorting domain-containing protein n=1 Tax=Winogradskyella thalassocola TaxID=262004 RepID=A0A1G8KAX3_9FLAO|nr:S8 family serine peptidase [Winogradskyella thalassocola]SDI40595.1 Por secretion system C-terminal sorting domain-containing protein [Winogradskyella thalassocola]
MKNYLFPIVFLALLNFGHSQNTSTVTISQENLNLIKHFEAKEQNRLARVQTYLKSNPETKTTFKDGINITQIYDVVDGVVLYRSTNNLDAGRATKTSYLQVGGGLGLDLDGTGMTIGVWDGGPADASHPEFQNSTDTGSRVTIIDNAIVDDDIGFSSHATHVSGTISAKGVDPDAKGMATNINVKSYNWTNDIAEMIAAVNSATDPIILSNHSYGVPIVNNSGDYLPSWYMGSYNQDARDVDNVARNNPKYLIVASAGNNGTTSYPDGMYAGYDKLTSDKNAKNSLVIANAQPTLTLFNYDLQTLGINSSSSQGPTDDLRIKPDIAADGTNLTSSIPGGLYASFTGTSMSAPNTTGTLALLQQYYNQLNGDYMNSSTLRGLVCHTAVDDIAATGPDPKFGWGFLDAKVSAETILDATTGDALISEDTLSEDEIFEMTFSAQAGDKLKATICWTDMPGGISNQTLNDPTPRLVNDLDLRLSKDGNTFMPWKLDYSQTSGFSNSKGDNSVDNIEVVEIEAPTSGVYTLTITHKGTLKDIGGGLFDPKDQDFSLIITGSSLTLGTTDNALSNSLIVYPNPNNGEFTISFDSNLNNNSDVKVDIYDISGRLVYKNSFVNDSVRFNKTINLSGVASGVYIANISKGNNITSQKIIIE